MKKINFSDRFGLTQAVLDGRKTMTRRIVPQSTIDKYALLEDPTIIDDARYDVGEVVAIAQSYKDAGVNPQSIIWLPIKESKTKGVLQCEAKYSSGWTNKMFVCADLMPHHIRITDVKAERLQDISDEDCIKEGISFIDKIKKYYFDRSDRDQGFYYYTAKRAFAALIDKVSGKGTWDSNPWVFAYEFELVD